MTDSILDLLQQHSQSGLAHTGTDRRFATEEPNFEATSLGIIHSDREMIEKLSGRLKVIPTKSETKLSVKKVPFHETVKQLTELKSEPIESNAFLTDAVSRPIVPLKKPNSISPGLTSFPSVPSSSGLPIVPIPDDEDEKKQESKEVCTVCNEKNSINASFCQKCGSLLKFGHRQEEDCSTEASVLSWTPNSDLRAFLIAINDDGSEGKRIPIEFIETIIGRETESPFPSDSFLSPKHARLLVENGKLYIQDLNSFNGTFIKLRQERALKSGDTFLMGRQVLCFEEVEQRSKLQLRASDGTRKMGSPATDSPYRLLQIGIGGVLQNVYCLPKIGAQLGRERGDIIFPHDKFMSSRHAQIYQRSNGQFVIADLNSSNGTWIKIWGLTPLETQDYIFMGQQLFRVFIDK